MSETKLPTFLTMGEMARVLGITRIAGLHLATPGLLAARTGWDGIHIPPAGLPSNCLDVQPAGIRGNQK